MAKEMYITPVLYTDRLVLKKGTFEDYVKVYEYDFTRLRDIAGEFEFVKLDPESIKGFDTYALEEPNVLDFIVYLKDTMEPIGNLVMDRYDEGNKSLELSYNIHPAYWKKGYAYESSIKVMDWVFSNLDIDNIVCRYAKDNTKSEKLNKKIGFDYVCSKISHYIRIDKDVEEIVTNMTKDKFKELYNVNKNTK